MFNSYGLARIGRDAELRSTTSGDQVASVSLAFTIYVKREKTTQWVEGALWGDRAEKLAPYLLKGTAVAVSLQDVHIEQFTKQDGTPMSKLVGRIADIDLAGGGEQRAPIPAPRQAPAPAPRPAPRAAPVSSTGFDDMEDDIPFASSVMAFDMEPRLTRRMRKRDCR